VLRDPACLGQDGLAVRDVAQHRVAHDDVERVVAERQVAAVGDLELELGSE
jgi:hypothetical protein